MNVKKPIVRATLAGLLLASAAWGCQLTGSPLQPVVVDYGSVELGPQTRLAVVINVTKAQSNDYRAQAIAPSAAASASPSVVIAPAPTPSTTPTIASIEVSVSGPQLPTPLVGTVKLSQVQNGQASVNFNDVPPGPVDVALVAKDADGNIVAHAEQSGVQIVANQTAYLRLHCDTSLGGLDVTCDCLPSTAPSNSPTPTPTPANPSSTGLNVSNFNVDKKGNIYLDGITDINRHIGHNRIVVIDSPNLNIESNYLCDSSSYNYTAGLTSVPGHLYSFMGNGNLLDINTDTEQVSSRASGVPTWCGLSAADNAGNLIVEGQTAYMSGAFYRLPISGGSPTLLKGFQDPISPTGPSLEIHAPEDIQCDMSTGQPVWGSATGIWTLDSNESLSQIVTTPATGNPDEPGVPGLLMPDQARDANEILFAVGKDYNLYLYDSKHPGTYTSVATSKNGYPSKLEIGADGNYYLLLTQYSLNYFANNFNGGVVGPNCSNEYRIIKFAFDPVTHAFNPLQTLVDCLPSSGPSF